MSTTTTTKKLGAWWSFVDQHGLRPSGSLSMQTKGTAISNTSSVSSRMTDTPSVRRPFYCREWAFEKLQACLDKRGSSATCGTLIMADSGCGKTSLCLQLVYPSGKGRQVTLSKRVLASHFCTTSDLQSLSVRHFLCSLTKQIAKHELMSSFRERFPGKVDCLEPDDIANVDEFMQKSILGVLNNLSYTASEAMYILVDALDEDQDQQHNPLDKEEEESKSIAQLFSKHHRQFPKWLALVCSCNSKVKKITRLFTGFRKLSLDDISKAHVIRDIQQYILYRLDREDSLRKHLNKDTAEILDKLHVKSNGCMLYIEMVLDIVSQGVVSLRQVRDIPGTLAGLYMWQCQRIFPSKEQFSRIAQPMFNVMLASRRPMTLNEIYLCLLTRTNDIQIDEVRRCIDSLHQILKQSHDGHVTFSHSSFPRWLQDVKFCSQTYLCNTREGHEMLALSHTLQASSLSHSEVCDYALHLQQCNDAPDGLNIHEQAVWMILSGANMASDDEQGSMAGSFICHETVEDEMQECDIPEDVNGKDDKGSTPLCHCASTGDVVSMELLLKRDADVNLFDSVGQTPLIVAARSGHVEAVQRLLDAGSDVNHIDMDGWTALRGAAWGGHSHVVSCLLDAGAEVDCPDREQRTALRVAAWAGHESIVSLLIDHEADVNRKDIEGQSTLSAAANMGHKSIVSNLLKHGADMNSCDNLQRTALCVACLCVPTNSQSSSHVEVARMLIAAGSNVNHTDKDGYTPLHLASYEGHLALCKELVSAGAEVDSVDNCQQTPLLCAVSMGFEEVTYFLVGEEADLYHLDKDGRTALSLACLSGHIGLVKKFLELGMDELHRDNYGANCLHLAAMEGHHEVVKQLLGYDGDIDTDSINSQDDQGRTPLFLAAQNGKLDVVNILLSYNSDVDLMAHNGKSPLRIAATQGHTACVQTLITHGADLSYKDMEGRTTLYMLALENKHDIVQLIVDGGADVNAGDEEGRTALHVACWQGHAEVVSVLLELNAEVNSLDNERRTPLQSAAWQGHANIADQLCRRGAHVNHVCDQGATPLCISTQEGFTDVVSVLCEYGADPGHVDKFGRTALKVAMKANNSEMLRVLEDVMRKHKPSLSDRSEKTNSSNTDHVVYANMNIPPHTHNKSNSASPQSQRSTSHHDNNSHTSGHALRHSGMDADYNQLEEMDLDSRKPHVSPYAVHTVLSHSKVKHNVQSPSSDGSAPSTISSHRSSSDRSSTDKSSHDKPTPQPRRDHINTFTEQLVKYRHGSMNVDQVLGGDVGYMANPKLNRAMFRASQEVPSNSCASKPGGTPQVNKSKPLHGRSIPVLNSRSRSKQAPAGGRRMSGVQNTARAPAYKVQYAAQEQTQSNSPSAYAVRKNELTSANHSISATSKTAKVISSSASPGRRHSTQESAPSPPPKLPPRRTVAPTPLQNPPLYGSAQRPTLVGVVRPSAQTPSYDSQSTHRSRKETSL